MELSCQKSKKSRRKRKHLSRYQNKQRKRIQLEVMFGKQGTVKDFISIEDQKRPVGTMEAKSYWENHARTQDWQNRHNIIWWRTRCHALEHENNILKDKIRSLLSKTHNNQRPNLQATNIKHTTYNEPLYQKSAVGENLLAVDEADMEDEEYGEDYEDGDYDEEDYGEGYEENGYEEEEDYIEGDAEEENEKDFLTVIDEDMMQFLEQSIQHKMELKKVKDSGNQAVSGNAEKKDDTELDKGQMWVKERSESAQLLYGEANPRILAMETALQATIERHRDKVKPQLWPNIPLNIKFN